MHGNNNIVVLILGKSWQNVFLFLSRFEFHGPLDEILFHVADADALTVQKREIGGGFNLLLRVGYGEK